MPLMHGLVEAAIDKLEDKDQEFYNNIAARGGSIFDADGGSIFSAY
jgi:hypothetical protein